MESFSNKISLMLIVDFIHTISGGTENQLIKIINNLPQEKYLLHLVSLRYTSWITSHVADLPCDVRIYNFRKLRNPKNIYSFIHMMTYIRRIFPDIVITFFPLSNILGVICAMLANVKVIISTRRDYGLWLNSWSTPILRIANKFVKKIIANSEAVKTLMSEKEKVDSSKIHVIYNGLELSERVIKNEESQALKTRLGIQPNSKVIGILANLRTMKRHIIFFKAAKRVKEMIDEVEFLVVGDGPLRGELENITARLGIERYIHFVGNQNDILPFLAIFDVGVNCSQNEGLSNAIMEYMAYGVPSIVAEAGGNQELIEDEVNGYTFELDNDEKLADMIVKLLSDKTIQEEYKHKSREKIYNKFTLDKMIMHYDDLFTQLMDGNR